MAETYVVRIDGDVYTVRLHEGGLDVALGEAEDADLDMKMNRETFYGLVSGEVAPKDAKVKLSAGNREALEQFTRIFSFAPRFSTAA